VDATEVEVYDLGGLRSTTRESVFERELFWLNKLQSEPGLPAVMRLRSHGWVEADDLTYAMVIERAEASLARLLETGTLEL
jgi:hypothetical protein